MKYLKTDDHRVHSVVQLRFTRTALNSETVSCVVKSWTNTEELKKDSAPLSTKMYSLRFGVSSCDEAVVSLSASEEFRRAQVLELDTGTATEDFSTSREIIRSIFKEAEPRMVTTEFGTVQTDEASIAAIRLALDGSSDVFQWRLKDNSVVDLDREDLEDVLNTVSDFVQGYKIESFKILDRLDSDLNALILEKKPSNLKELRALIGSLNG